MSLYSQVTKLVTRGRAVSLATLVGKQPEGGPPEIGAKMLIPGDGSAPTGSIHSDIDGLLRDDAANLLQEERSRIITYATSSHSYDVFIESFPLPPHLVIVGAVHIAVPLARLARMLAFRVTVVDPRRMFATEARFPDADQIIVDWPEDAFPGLDVGPGTSVAVLTHDPKIDVPALMLALTSGALYVGALGSRNTISERKTALADLGATPEQLARIHGPIGLDIGARTPSEIALAVMAEVVAVRRALPDRNISKIPQD